MIARRSFLAGILAASTAPAIAMAESLMKVRRPRAHGWGQGEWLLVPSDDGRAWEEALRTGQGWMRWTFDPAAPGADATGLALLTGEIGLIDSEIRFIESPLLPADIDREYRETLKRQPVSRSDFLGEFLSREVDLAPRPPRFSADSVVRRLRRW